MSITIFEALMNANYNFHHNMPLAFELAKRQLNNAVILLEKDYELYDEVEPLLKKYGSVENVPEKGNPK